MQIFLAPMEGVVDHTMRALLTGIGGIDRCVTEFVRVTDVQLPPRVFYRYCPELRQGGVTSSGGMSLRSFSQSRIFRQRLWTAVTYGAAKPSFTNQKKNETTLQQNKINNVIK